MNFGNNKQISEKRSDYAFKITHIAAARCPNLPIDA